MFIPAQLNVHKCPLCHRHRWRGGAEGLAVQSEILISRAILT